MTGSGAFKFDRNELIYALDNGERSARDIAEIIGCSRNTVIGVLWRFKNQCAGLQACGGTNPRGFAKVAARVEKWRPQPNQEPA